MKRLILASGSPHRSHELARLGLPFDAVPAAVDETPGPGEHARELAVRLARAKARAVAGQRPGTVVIGSDQAAALDGPPIGKPGSLPAARAQLLAASGRRMEFYTALCVITADGRVHEHLDVTTVHFRELGADEVDRYLAAEMPLDCAGSFKCEGLGISLFEAIVCRDPSALVGLPLIALAALLRREGFSVP